MCVSVCGCIIEHLHAYQGVNRRHVHVGLTCIIVSMQVFPSQCSYSRVLKLYIVDGPKDVFFKHELCSRGQHLGRLRKAWTFPDFSISQCCEKPFPRPNFPMFGREASRTSIYFRNVRKIKVPTPTRVSKGREDFPKSSSCV